MPADGHAAQRPDHPLDRAGQERYPGGVTPETAAWLDGLAAGWRAERVDARAQVAAARVGRSLAERVARGRALAGLRITEERAASRDRSRAYVAVPDAIDLDNLRLTPGDPIRLWAERPDEAGAIRGVLERRDGQGLWLVLDRAVDELDRDYALDGDAPEVSFDRGDRALARAHAAPGNSDLARIRDVAAGARPPRPLAATRWTPLDPALDEVQRAAVEHALRSGDLALLHGPPGTGKTRTLVEVIRQRVARGERILATAPSNVAVDNLGERLARAGVTVVRLGHPARVAPALTALTLDAQVDADGATDLARQWRDRAAALRKSAAGRPGSRELWAEARALERDAARELANAERAIVARADVVLTTCVGADAFVLGDDVFDAVIVDEATQTPDPLLLIALARGKVAVLAGDPCQLGPVVRSRGGLAAGLATTVFERLAAAAGASPVMLEQQHRMHAEIMAFPSTTKYGGRLRAAPAVADHRLEQLGVAADPLRPRPLWLLDTAGKDWTEERSDEPDGDPSTSNPGNAERVAAEARRLISRGLPASDLAVITTYAAQARRLRELLVAERAAGLEIGTVDGFQGREKEAVIVDTVRSNERGELGFLADTRRMNVALTRARRFLLVVADSATLGEHPYYAALLGHVDALDAHGSAWSDDGDPL
jgi:DNA polymerase III delta prime subunit